MPARSLSWFFCMCAYRTRGWSRAVCDPTANREDKQYVYFSLHFLRPLLLLASFPIFQGAASGLLPRSPLHLPTSPLAEG